MISVPVRFFFGKLTCKMKQKALLLIQIHSKTWLAQQLGISRKTLYERLESDNWRKLEIQQLLRLTR